MVLQQLRSLETTENGTFEIQDHIETQKYNNHEAMKEYPQVRKTGVDAVHDKLPTEENLGL